MSQIGDAAGQLSQAVGSRVKAFELGEHAQGLGSRRQTTSFKLVAPSQKKTRPVVLLHSTPAQLSSQRFGALPPPTQLSRQPPGARADCGCASRNAARAAMSAAPSDDAPATDRNSPVESRLVRTFEPAAKLEAAAKKNTFQPAALAIKIYHAMLYGIVHAPERRLRQRRKHATHGTDEMRSASGSRLLRRGSSVATCMVLCSLLIASPQFCSAPV